MGESDSQVAGRTIVMTAAASEQVFSGEKPYPLMERA
jgi:hypothetical protein